MFHSASVSIRVRSTESPDTWEVQGRGTAPESLDVARGNAARLASGAPAIFDPAVYFGDRETDLAMTELFGLIRRVAPYDVSVLVEGETGSGKELVAGQIHRLSSRAHQSFVTLNCGACAGSYFSLHLWTTNLTASSLTVLSLKLAS